MNDTDHSHDRAMIPLTAAIGSPGHENPTVEPDSAQSEDDCRESFFQQVNIEFLLHELKDPVSIIETGARMLLEKQADPSSPEKSWERTLKRILRNASKTREMLNELLEVGRAENACFNCHTFDPANLLRRKLLEVIEKDDPELYEQVQQAAELRECIAQLAQKGIRLDIAPAAEGIRIFQDELKFSQIMGNLIKNGLYYRRRQLLVHLSYHHDQVVIAVRDDGPGIAPAHHEDIFKRYKQIMPDAGLARSGHGLGLAVARIMARTMGGDITIESQLGYGALFKLSLPVHPPDDRTSVDK